MENPLDREMALRALAQELAQSDGTAPWSEQHKRLGEIARRLKVEPPQLRQLLFEVGHATRARGEGFNTREAVEFVLKSAKDCPNELTIPTNDGRENPFSVSEDEIYFNRTGKWRHEEEAEWEEKEEREREKEEAREEREAEREARRHEREERRARGKRGKKGDGAGCIIFAVVAMLLWFGGKSCLSSPPAKKTAAATPAQTPRATRTATATPALTPIASEFDEEAYARRMIGADAPERLAARMEVVRNMLGDGRLADAAREARAALDYWKVPDGSPRREHIKALVRITEGMHGAIQAATEFRFDDAASTLRALASDPSLGTAPDELKMKARVATMADQFAVCDHRWREFEVAQDRALAIAEEIEALKAAATTAAAVLKSSAIDREEQLRKLLPDYTGVIEKGALSDWYNLRVANLTDRLDAAHADEQRTKAQFDAAMDGLRQINADMLQ